jgi:hypothetical protein
LRNQTGHFFFAEMQIDTKELSVVKTQVSKALQAAQALQITSQQELTAATDVLSKIKTVGKIIKEKKEAITRPMNEALKQARALFAPIEENYEEAERVIKSKMLAYQQEVDRKAREEQAKIEARVERGTIKPETAIKKVAAIENVGTTVSGNRGGEVQFRTVRRAQIENEALLPREYLIPNVTKINEDAIRKNIEIPGVKVIEEKVVASR